MCPLCTHTHTPTHANVGEHILYAGKHTDEHGNVCMNEQSRKAEVQMYSHINMHPHSKQAP